MLLGSRAHTHTTHNAASITESGDTALGLAVRKEKLGVITFLVTECCVNVNSESKLYGYALVFKISVRYNQEHMRNGAS